VTKVWALQSQLESYHVSDSQRHSRKTSATQRQFRLNAITLVVVHTGHIAVAPALTHVVVYTGHIAVAPALTLVVVYTGHIAVAPALVP
jgi:hypothetical protein